MPDYETNNNLSALLKKMRGQINSRLLLINIYFMNNKPLQLYLVIIK